MTFAPTLDDRSAAYDRMAHALSFLGDHWHHAPRLADAARAVGLSAHHFQREFSLWAGLSPKQYVAALAHGVAGDALNDGASVLDASFEAGLSSPSRLHDLFIAHEGLSPGEAKSGGDGLTLGIGRGPTPFGDGVWLWSPRGLCGLGFIDDQVQAPEAAGQKTGRGETAAFADLAARYPNADIRRDDAAGADWSRRAFDRSEPLPLALYGTPFRLQVWRALMAIPVGETWSYGALAKSIGRPDAARAVGTAVGANPLSWFIPCHRALAADRRLHNYHWGVRRKRCMLTLEWARMQA